MVTEVSSGCQCSCQWPAANLNPSNNSPFDGRPGPPMCQCTPIRGSRELSGLGPIAANPKVHAPDTSEQSMPLAVATRSTGSTRRIFHATVSHLVG
jgi:hypothetical protein